MSNMPHCRFENTLQDLQDCSEHLTDLLEIETEINARYDLVYLCAEILNEFGFEVSLRTVDLLDALEPYSKSADCEDDKNRE